MTLQLIQEELLPKKKRRIHPKQMQGVENPATVLLHPVHFGDPDIVPPTVQWWSHDGVLLGGLKVNGVKSIEGGERSDSIAYLPTPVPRSWEEKEFKVCVEYECEHPGSIFQFRLHYGCGDPSELHKGETDFLEGQTGEKKRVYFSLHRAHLVRNELFRATLEVVRVSPKPILVYGAWLEVGV